MPKITENAKSHQKCQKSSKITKNAKYHQTLIFLEKISDFFGIFRFRMGMRLMIMMMMLTMKVLKVFMLYQRGWQ